MLHASCETGTWWQATTNMTMHEMLQSIVHLNAVCAELVCWDKEMENSKTFASMNEQFKQMTGPR